MSQRVICTIGCQGSGKTFWSKELIASDPTYKRVNRDDLRSMCDNGVWSKQNEALIIKMQNQLILLYLEELYNVIVDNTGFGPQLNIVKEVIDSYTNHTGKKVNLEIRDFTDVPIEVCIERDLKRASSVGSKVILDTYNRYCKKQEPKAEINISGLLVVIADLDGTLSIHNNRSPYEFNKIDTDLPNKNLIVLLQSLLDNQIINKIIILTGREAKYLEQSKQWLYTYLDRPFDIFSRATDDRRPDDIIKEEIYRAEIENKFSVLAVFDDRPRILRLWERLGLPAYSVGNITYEF